MTCSNANLTGKLTTKSTVGSYDLTTTLDKGTLSAIAYLSGYTDEPAYSLTLSPTELSLFKAGGTSNTYATLTTDKLMIKRRDGYTALLGDFASPDGYPNYLGGNLKVYGKLYAYDGLAIYGTNTLADQEDIPAA